jgi:hypothetical protein
VVFLGKLTVSQLVEKFPATVQRDTVATLRGEHRLRVNENGVLRKIFGPKGDEVTGGWIKLHNFYH